MLLVLAALAYSLGERLEASGRRETAEAWYERALRLDAAGPGGR